MPASFSVETAQPGAAARPAGAEWKLAVCPLDCADTCSLKVEVVDGKMTKVRGGRANPLTGGRICTKVARGLTHQVYGRNRLTTPLAKTPSGFQPVSWDEALGTIHRKYTDIIAEFGAQAIVPLAYGGPMGLLAGGSMDKRFFNRLGATRVWTEPLCAGVSAAAWDSVFGEAGGMPYTELADSKLIVIWGNNITGGHLHLIKIIRQARRRGAKVVVVDPKRIRIADEADLHLPIRPGTDVVLGYAVAAALERRGAVDRDFIAAHVSGADRYLAEARKHSLEFAAQTCGLELADLGAFVDYWASLSPVGVSVGVAPERNRNGGSGLRTIYALAALTGNIGRQGAGICEVSGLFPVNRSALERDDLRAEDARELNILDVPQHILGDDLAVPIKSVFIYNHNPVAVHPQQRAMRQALSKPDLFVVGCDLTMTDSMAMADIVLPAASHLEAGDIYKSYGHQFLQRAEPVIEPVGDALPNTEIFRRLARQFGFEDEAFAESDAQLMAASISPEHPALGGRSALELATDACVDLSVGAPGLLDGAPPTTPSGRIELYCEALEQSCGMGLPWYRPLERRRRFLLVSPASENRTNSTFGGEPGHDDDLAVEMHPADAAESGVEDGQPARLINDFGEVVLPVRLSDRPRPGTVYVPKGGWLRSYPGKESINVLVPGHKADLGEGACYNDTEVDIVAA